MTILPIVVVPTFALGGAEVLPGSGNTLPRRGITAPARYDLRRIPTPEGIASGWIGAAPPASSRPAWLRPYAFVTGTIASAPLDLEGRMEQVYAALKAAGWTTVVRSIGTDFAGPLGVPVPKDQPLELYIHRTDRPYTALEAQAALREALRALDMTYSATGAWLGEVTTQVVLPTIQQAQRKAEGGFSAILGAIPWVAAGAIAFAILRIAPKKG